MKRIWGYSLLFGLVGLVVTPDASTQPKKDVPARAPAPAPTPTPTPSASPLFSSRLNDGPTTLRGFADLHTHPMAHLGFGGHALYGAPDVGVLMPAGHIYRNNDCNQNPERARTQAEALGSCYSAHAGHDMIKNKCGNHIRRLVINGLEDGNKTNKPHDISDPPGHPSFTKWPKHDDILHQQMWVEWVERAYKGGLRVMVALAVNNFTLATGMETSAKNPRTDKASADLQISELKRFVAKHKWMEIAYSAKDVRRIIGQNDKLAVVIGVELDDPGDFMVNKSKPSPAAVRAEISRLHGLGVRYAFPIHLIDNFFAGTAVYENDLNRANCFHHGDWWKLECTAGRGRDEAGITHKASGGWDVFVHMKLGHCGGTAPITSCKPGEGHVNSKGLTDLGRVAIDEMMRLGMIIDIDHASLKSVLGILDHTKAGGGYPLVSGHNALRPATKGTENQRTKAQYIELAQRKGLAGVGWGHLTSDEWLRRLQDVRATGVALALGSDVNGLVVQAAPRKGCTAAKPCVEYSSSFPKPGQWDYNKDGVAHIGLFPDVLRDIETQPGGKPIVETLFDGAEAFAVTWERAESLRGQVAVAPATGGMTITSAQYGNNCGIQGAKADLRSIVTDQCAGETSCDYEFTWAKWGGDPNPSMCTKEIVINYRCGATNKVAKVQHKQTPQKVNLSCR